MAPLRVDKSRSKLEVQGGPALLPHQWAAQTYEHSSRQFETTILGPCGQQACDMFWQRVGHADRASN
eukprot:3164510-Prorocentrum_lima.AAC.1